MHIPRLALFTRYPAAGEAKTRLIPAVGAAGAAQIHRRLTERTVSTLVAGARLAGGGPRAVEVHYTGAGEAAFRKWLGGELRYVAQPAGDLSARLLAALEPAPVLFFGADTPDLAADDVAQAVSAVVNGQTVIGPAADGGYYLIGIGAAHRFLFTDMPWSTPALLPETLARLAARRMVPRLLRPLCDCDTPDDLARWPWLVA